MAGTLTDLTVAGKLAVRAVGRRLSAEIEGPPDLNDFVTEMEALLNLMPDSAIKEYHWVDLPATQPPWVSTGVQLQDGDEVSYFAAGRVYANRFLDIYVQPQQQLWCKIGETGEVFRGTRASHTFRAVASGEMLFGNYFPNDWSDTQGRRKQDDKVYKDVSGELKILVIRWADDAREALQKLQSAAGPNIRVSDEITRIEQGDTTPPGWHYLWHLGPAEIYRHENDTEVGECIRCCTHGDVGILQRDIDLPLVESSELSWRWCVSQLPSTLREDSLPTHDYLSIAVEFDNGRDITYYWSSALAVGTGYDCPLPNWAGKEFHVVVRSGDDGLGQWQSERRNLYDDYLQYMGTPPARITRVWLIANSIFQRGEGACDYADIVLTDVGSESRLL